MTRFARAKGSKASNERVPDEATPWNVMKMQLEDSQAASQPAAKPKTARQLLADKDEPFYHDTASNVNHEWATFDDVDAKEKKSVKNKSGKVHKNDDKKKEGKKMENAAKLHLANDNEQNQVTEDVNKSENEPLETLETVDKTGSKKTKEKRARIESEIVESPKADDKSVNDDKSGSKSKKRAKKSKKPKAIANNAEEEDRSEIVASEGGESKTVEVASVDKSSDIDGKSEKLSKRQKRNKKKQLKIASDKNEAKVKEVEAVVEKEGGPKGFDVLGNEWSNEVKFGRQNNPRELTTSGNNEAERIKKFDKKKEKNTKKVSGEGEGGDGDEKQSDNTSSEKTKGEEKGENVQGSKAQKRKGGKNDSKEYKRRKPDEGVVKMIINGNEIEVVKYDGFPVKKEDAERLKELKKNMIIKGANWDSA